MKFPHGKEVDPLCHPLGEENKLVIAPGLLSGSAGAMSGRLSVRCKSPLTGGIKEANSGGQAAQVLARLGYAAIELVHEVGKGTPPGRILGNGAGITGKVFGVEMVPVVKNQALPAYDPRSIQGIGVTYATSTQGADHTAGYSITANILKVGGFVDPLKPEGQVELSRNLQIATVAIDSTGMCLFIAFAILDQPETFQAMLDMPNSFHGLNLTADDVADLGKKILAMERDFNKKAGFTSADDRLPAYFYKEKLAPHNALFTVTDEELDSVFNW